VIQVTLNFPDQAALLAFFTSPALPGDVGEAPKAAKEKAKAVAVPVASVSAPSTAPKSEPAQEPVATTSSVKPSESAVGYPTLQKAVFALAGKSRDAAAAVAKSFDVKTFRELPEAKWGEALVAVNAALAEAA
jgi:hypothetical protein